MMLEKEMMKIDNILFLIVTDFDCPILQGVKLATNSCSYVFLMMRLYWDFIFFSLAQQVKVKTLSL